MIQTNIAAKKMKAKSVLNWTFPKTEISVAAPGVSALSAVTSNKQAAY